MIMNPQNDNATACELRDEDVACSRSCSALQKGNFYSVYVPLEARSKDIQISENIFTDKVEALKLVKKTKKARFKHFQYYNEALDFALTGLLEFPNQQNELLKNVTTPVGNEKISLFKGPKPQELVKLRKCIEIGDIRAFTSAIWENPRYLVSSGDTPSILQEGFRYNALHCAAKAKNGPIAEVILSTISNYDFIKLLYGDDQNENIESRTQVLLDLYLNTPDKGLNETPLHFASKFGAVNVVEVLVTFPECDKTLKNKYGHTPDMIICDRCEKKDTVLERKISKFLENCYYVPVLRAEDESVAPSIGEPFSVAEPHLINKDPLSPRLEIHAYAGPMNKEGADQFRKVWKTPPRTSTPIRQKKKMDRSLDSIISLRYTDLEKGLERFGQKLANKFDVSWKEYWSFLDCFIDITSEEGLQMLEEYLATQIGNTDVSLCESFEDVSYSKRSISTIADLCLQLQKCNLSDDLNDDDFNAYLCVEKACNVFANRIAGDIFHKSADDLEIQVNVLEMQTKQVELLVLSYLEDSRFNKVNFGQLHTRLGLLINQKLCKLVEKSKRVDYIRFLERLLATCSKNVECYSSDDEANCAVNNKPTSSQKQLICMLQHVLDTFGTNTEPKVDCDNEQVCKEAWIKSQECGCVYSLKRHRRSFGLNRNNNKYSKKGKAFQASRKDLFGKKEAFSSPSSSSSDEDFFTPPSSPSLLKDSDSDSSYAEPPPLAEVFLENNYPTKVDNDLYKALKYSACTITPLQFPNIYRWYHNVNLYDDYERESWPRPKLKYEPKLMDAGSPISNYSTSKASVCSPRSSSWLRSGVNSPRSSLRRKLKI